MPFGLCLTVALTPESFLPARDTVSGRTISHDVKIDVFFNGQLCGSSFVAERFHAKNFEMTRHKVRFSGRKVGFLVEKPWVLVPPGQNANATSREHHHRVGEVYAGAQPRWAAISEALEAEARRVGRDELGGFSLLGKHLMNLANLRMPPEVEYMQKAGGPKFGVIDVVVIAGKGLKDDVIHRNLTEPTAFRLKSVTPKARNDFTNSSDLTSKESKECRNKSRQAGEKTDDEKAIGASREMYMASIESRGHQLQDYLGNTSGTESFGILGKGGQISSSRPEKDYGSSASPFRLDDSPSFSRSSSEPDPLGRSNWAESFGRVDTPGQGSSPRPDQPADLSAYLSEQDNPIHFSRSPHLKSYLANHVGDSSWIKPVQRPKAKKSLPYEYVMDDKMTLYEEFQSLVVKAKQSQSGKEYEPKKELRNPVSRNARASRSGTADRGASILAGPSKAVDPTSNEQKNIVLSKPKRGPVPFTPLPIQPIISARASSPVDTVMKDASSPTSLSSGSSYPMMRPSHRAAAPPTRREPNTSGASIRPTGRRRGDAGPGWDTSWTTPPLSQDSVLTYAPDGLVRSVKLERSGWFKEMEMVMAVRYLVG